MRGRWTAVGLVLLAVVAGLALLAERPPAPVPASAPATEFSAGRALPVVADLAREPHPVGSPASDRIRDDLVTRLAAAGLVVRVDASAGAAVSSSGSGTRDRMRAARVENVVATLPGTAPTGQVVLMAHDDSVPGGPGAADDTSGVAALLETVRALRAGPPLRNDVVVLVTDGEEAGLLGAGAWVRDHLAADRRPTVTLNVEARGVAGPALLFQTSPGNAELVRTWADAVPHPRGDSSLVEVYRFLPNDTDLSRVLAVGRPGMNSAFIERPVDYHTAGDSPANLDAGSLQNQGSTMLALARGFGDRDLAPLDPAVTGAPRAGDTVYFRFLGLLVTHPAGASLPLAGLAALLAVVAVGLARLRGRLGVGRTVVCGASVLVAVGVGALLAVGLWRLLVLVRPAYADLGPFLGRPVPYEAAVAALALLVVLGWAALVRRWAGGAAVAGGVALLLAVLGVGLAAVAPGASFLLALPSAGLSLGLAVAVLLAGRSGPVPLVGALLVGAVPAVALLLPLAVSLFDVGGVGDGVAAGAFVLVGTAVAGAVSAGWTSGAGTSGAGTSAAGAPGSRQAPVGGGPTAGSAEDASWSRSSRPPRRRRRPVVVALGLVGLVVVLAGTGLVVDRASPASPWSTHLAYVLDGGRASWVTRDTAPRPWTAGYASGPPVVDPAWPGGPVRTGPAPALALPPPVVRVVSRAPSRLELLVTSPRGARTVSVRADGVTTATVAFPDRPAVTGALDPAGPSRVRVDDVPPEGVRITLVGAAPGPRSVVVADETTGLDAVPGYVPRPPELRRSPDADSDLVILWAPPL